MSLLIQNSSQYLPKETILLKVWGYDANVNSNSVEAYISFCARNSRCAGSCVSISVETLDISWDVPMIRKLRWKFSAIMMTIVAFLLAVIFITLYYTTKANYVQRSMGTLHSAMLENYPGSMREQAGQPPSAGQRPPSRPRRQGNWMGG